MNWCNSAKMVQMRCEYALTITLVQGASRAIPYIGDALALTIALQIINYSI